MQRFFAAVMIAVALFVCQLSTSSFARSNLAVDLVLVLALDVSASVDGQEYDLQRQGFAEAFRSSKVVNAIQRGPYKRIAVSAVQWSGQSEQAIAIPWTIVSGRESADLLGASFATMPRRYFSGRTDIAGTIEFASAYALAAPVRAPRHVVDISGDGLDNVRYATHNERDRAVLAGLTINALAILNEVPDLDNYYRRYVVGGPQSFVMTTRNYRTFSISILRKLLREINTQFLTTIQPPELTLAHYEAHPLIGARNRTHFGSLWPGFVD